MGQGRRILPTLRHKTSTAVNMSTIPSLRPTGVNVRILVCLSASAAALLAGCVVAPAPAPRVYAPPPPVYAPPPPAYAPPPPAYAEPAVAVEVQAPQPPPPLPEYVQPPCPEEGYLWTPGYWAFANGGYYWVPGTWVQPPRVGFLWTPGYWGFVGGLYLFHAGYWGPHVGFYGGVNYGYGYVGTGFAGGYWAGNRFAYNTAVVNVNTTVVHNTYVNNTVVNNTTVNRVSYNGGTGGVTAAPTPQERVVMQESHVPLTQVQHQHVQEAVRNPQLAASANGGHPPIAATPRPAVFNAPGVVGAKGAPPRAPTAVNPAYGAHGNINTGNAVPGAGHPPAGNPQVGGYGHPSGMPPQAPAGYPAAGGTAYPSAAAPLAPATKLQPQPPKPAHPAPPPAEKKHENEGNKP
jgi:hypothetical protein